LFLYNGERGQISFVIFRINVFSFHQIRLERISIASKTAKRETGANLGLEAKLASAVLILFLKKPNQPQDGTEIIYWRDEK
jgi:hypothetical protein